MSWFLESWSVAEGCAFIAHRNYSLADGVRSNLDPPVEIVYVCPPHFVPTPASYSMALSAARGRFQERFYDGAGAEVAFDRLGLAIELVRRAYLASSAGGSPPPPDGARPPGPPDPDVLDDAAEEQQWLEAIRRLRTARLPSERSGTAQYLSSIWSPRAANGLRGFCTDVLDALASEAAARRHDPRLERDFRDFAVLSVEMNDWGGYEGGAHFIRQALEKLATSQGWFTSRGPHPEAPPYCWPTGTTDGLSAALAAGLLERLPSPVCWKPYKSLTRLGDHMAAAAADREYLRSLTSFAHVLPLLTGALAMAAAESYRFRVGGPFADAATVRDRAFDWLARELPDDKLDAFLPATEAVREVLEQATSPSTRSML